MPSSPQQLSSAHSSSLAGSSLWRPAIDESERQEPSAEELNGAFTIVSGWSAWRAGPGHPSQHAQPTAWCGRDSELCKTNVNCLVWEQGY